MSKISENSAGSYSTKPLDDYFLKRMFIDVYTCSKCKKGVIGIEINASVMMCDECVHEFRYRKGNP